MMFTLAKSILLYYILPNNVNYVKILLMLPEQYTLKVGKYDVYISQKHPSVLHFTK